MSELSIIIPTLNRDRFLNTAILSLIRQTFPPMRFEILVVDNGSSDSTNKVTEEFITAFPSHQIRYIYEPEPGLLSGRHRGALEANGDILIFVDDDIEADPNWLKAIKESFDDSTVQLLGNQTYTSYVFKTANYLKCFLIQPSLWQNMW